MNNKTLILARILVKNGEGFGLKLKTKKAWALFLLGVVFLVPALLFSYIKLIGTVYHGLVAIEQQGVVLSWGLALNSLFIFIFGMFHIISSFYFSDDVENFLHLPLRPRQIVGAKFLVTIFYEYLIVAFLFLPILVYYGIFEGAGLFYYLYGLVVFVLIPVMPIALAALIVIFVMRFSNLSRHKELFKILGGILAMFFGIGLNLVFQSMATRVDENTVMELLEMGNNSLSIITSRMFPTIQWAIKALLDYNRVGGLINLLIFSGLSIGIYVILLYFGEWMYFKGVVGLSESSGSTITRNEDLGKIVKQNSVLRSYILVELKLLFRTPVYFLNCVLINIIWPVFIILPLLVRSTGDSEFNLGDILGILQDPQAAGIIIGVAIALITFIGGSNGTAATSISREGQQLYVKKHIPVSYRKQLTAKLLSSVILSYVGVIVLVLIMLLLYKLPLWIGLLLLVIGVLPAIFTSLTGVLLDLYNPKLDWDSEQKAVKQNLNVVFNVLISMVMGVIIGVITFVLRDNVILAITTTIAIVGLPSFLLYYFINTTGVIKFKQLER